MKLTISCLLVLGILNVGAATAYAQSDRFVPSPTFLTGLRDIDKRQSEADQKSDIAGAVVSATGEFALYTLGPSVYTSLAEENRLDKQVGSSSGSAGSTSLVSHGSVPSILGLAVEGGALYQAVSGNVVTFRLNPSGLARALTRNSYLASGPPADPAVLENAFSRISASASFDFSKGSTAGTFTAERSQLREASVRIDIINKRDPRHPSHARNVRRIREAMGPLAEKVNEYFEKVKAMPGYDLWVQEKADALFKASDDASRTAILESAADEFTQMFGSSSELTEMAEVMVRNIKSYRNVRNSVFAAIAKSPSVTFEYAFSKLSVSDEILAGLPAGTTLPDLSTARLIVASPLGNRGEASLNASATFFNSTMPDMRGNLRDLQVAAGFDFRLPELQGIGAPTFTVAGLGVFLHQQPFGLKVKIRDKETDDGPIGVFQTKLTFPAGKSGARIPLSFTVANRSEFNTETEVKGSIGLTFDLDKLFSR